MKSQNCASKVQTNGMDSWRSVPPSRHPNNECDMLLTLRHAAMVNRCPAAALELRWTHEVQIALLRQCQEQFSPHQRANSGSSADSSTEPPVTGRGRPPLDGGGDHDVETETTAPDDDDTPRKHGPQISETREDRDYTVLGGRSTNPQ